jgi:hypothetical protein
LTIFTGSYRIRTVAALQIRGDRMTPERDQSLAPSASHQGQTLSVSSLEALRKAESEVLGRLADNPGAAQLFIVDPVRALETVGVALTPEAVSAWEATVPGLADRDPLGRFDRLQKMGPDPNITVRVEGLLPPTGIDVTAEDNSLWQQMLGYTAGESPS